LTLLTRALRPRTTGRDPYRVLMVCSSGGHLAQLLRLRTWWEHRERTWVTFDTRDAESSLAGERVVIGHFPTTRNIPNLLRNAVLAVRMLLRDRPDVIVSNGAGLAVPFFWVGWLLRIPSVWVEVYDRIDSPTMTGRLVRPVASLFCVQWPEQLRVYPGATVIGPVW
jgi:UDP-N-acetylglucosamine:LPS N-acetylglucosamine transferase